MRGRTAFRAGRDAEDFVAAPAAEEISALVHTDFLTPDAVRGIF
ncbi:MAG: hypothetical protein VB021_02075 [Oscillospiraceae bacterium]|nr:hypothetical protein [Oscillospiraceae bacterium]